MYVRVYAVVMRALERTVIEWVFSQLQSGGIVKSLKLYLYEEKLFLRLLFV